MVRDAEEQKKDRMERARPVLEEAERMREAVGFTKKEMAQYIGVRPASYLKFVAGKTAPWGYGLKTIKRVLAEMRAERGEEPLECLAINGNRPEIKAENPDEKPTRVPKKFQRVRADLPARVVRGRMRVGSGPMKHNKWEGPALSKRRKDAAPYLTQIESYRKLLGMSQESFVKKYFGDSASAGSYSAWRRGVTTPHEHHFKEIKQVLLQLKSEVRSNGKVVEAAAPTPRNPSSPPTRTGAKVAGVKEQSKIIKVRCRKCGSVLNIGGQVKDFDPSKCPACGSEEVDVCKTRVVVTEIEEWDSMGG